MLDGAITPEELAIPFYEQRPHDDTLPMFRAMDAALAHKVGDHGRAQ